MAGTGAAQATATMADSNGSIHVPQIVSFVMAPIFKAEMFDKVVWMVVIGHHCPTITTSSCRIQFNNGNSEANDAPHRRVQTSKVRSPRCQGSELGSPPISCLPCSPSHVYLIHGPYTSQVSAHTRFRVMRDFSICRRSQQHCPPPAQRRAGVKFLWCAVCALAFFGVRGCPRS